jgi:hypothetical protein
MKPYRGGLLASAVLLAALPLSSCGDADTWKTTNGVSLSTSTPTVQVNEKAIFTASAAPMAEGQGYACDTDLEYRAQGAGLHVSWSNIPGIDTTRIFELKPFETTLGGSTLSVMARARCLESKEDWKYSEQVDVLVTEVILPVVTGVTLTATPTSVLGGTPVVFTVSVTKDSNCTLRVNTIVNGNRYTNFTDPAWSTTSGGTYSLPTDAVLTDSSLVIATEAYCTENSSARVSATVPVTVLAPAGP